MIFNVLGTKNHTTVMAVGKYLEINVIRIRTLLIQMFKLNLSQDLQEEPNSQGNKREKVLLMSYFYFN